MTESRPRRSGFVALIGSPNTGKSTLVNHLLGEKLCITTPRPQTTRDVIRAILTTDEAQVVLLDTPGIHQTGGRGLNEMLTRRARDTLTEVDLVVVLVDARFGGEDGFSLHPSDMLVMDAIEEAGRPAILAINKIDLVGDKRRILPMIDDLSKQTSFREIIPISALSGDGVDDLLAHIVMALPEGPLYYDPKLLTDRDMRFLASEFVREQIFLLCAKEVPYGSSVEIEAFEEPEDPRRSVIVTAKIHVERQSQKAILIGKGGAMIRRIGTRARRGIARLVNRKVHLELFVRVEPKWTKRPDLMKKLGYS